MKKALLIGINYTSVPDISLHGCIDDIINMRNVLIDAYDYSPSNITMLRDDDPHNLPTSANIMKNLLNLASQSNILDEIWVHYSGHGSQMNNPNSDEVTKIDSILVPLDYQDAGFIGEQTLLSVIQKIHCRAVLLFDSCHSGTICDLPYSIFYDGPGRFTKQVNNHIQVNNPNIFVMSGCKTSQTSADTYSDVLSEPVGAFTNAFIECLRNFRHNTDLLGLYSAVCENLAKGGFSQVPVLSTSVANPAFTLVRAMPPQLPQPVKTAKQSIQTILHTVATGKKGRV
jgi:hypothetical protein